jgi:hypothetical protein
MSKEALEQGTSNYQINYFSEASPSDPSTSSAENELISFHESLHDPIMERHRRRTARHRERIREREQHRSLEAEERPLENLFMNVIQRGRYRGPPGGDGDIDLGERPRTRLHHLRSGQPNPRERLGSGEIEDHCDWPLIDRTHHSNTPPPPFTVETDPADSASDGETTDDNPESRVRARLLAQMQDDGEESSPYDLAPLQPRSRPSFMDAGGLDPNNALDAQLLAGPAALPGADGMGPVHPQAKFFIQPGKSQVTVKFDPPV